MSTPPAAPKTTRICVKNVPPSFDDAKLRRHILESGPPSSATSNLTITDCRILKTKEGKSRKLAFVGFKTHDQAVRAVDAFHGTYAKTSRLAVELAFSKKASADETGHRPWSKHSKGSSRYERTHTKQEDNAAENSNKKKDGSSVRKVSEEMVNEKDGNKSAADEELLRKKEEFLQLMGASSAVSGGGKAKAWANDDVGVIGVSDKTDAKKKGSSSSSRKSAAEESDSNSSNKDDSDDSDSDSASDDSSVDSGGEGADALAGSQAAYAGAAVSDMDFFRSKLTAKDELLSDDEDDDDDEDIEERNDIEATNQPKNNNGNAGSSESSSSDSSDSSSSSSDDDSDSDEEEGDATGNGKSAENPKDSELSHASAVGAEEDAGYARDRLFVRNLPFAATEEELKEAFEAFGEVVECHIPIDDTKRNKGYAFVRFSSSNDALTARDALDGSDFQGRLMHVIPAKKAREEDAAGSGDGMGEGGDNMTYKKKQELARQKGAENVAAGWSSSFVRGDAVVDNLSERLGLAKGDILNVKDGLSSGGAAVRLALGETQIIEENREYFQQHGIDMNILVSGSSGRGVDKLHDVKRSKEMILVKNLPYDTTEDDLAKLFNGVGDAPSQILLPPSRTIALIEYGHAVDARKAFRKLAYKRFKHVPLYLEWAPLAAKQNESGTATRDTNKSSEDNEQEQVGDDEEEQQSTASTLYCKNLNFSTTEEQLLEAFKRSGHKARAVRIPTKLAPVKKMVGRALPGAEPEMRQLSMGFGFIEFDSDTAARKAMKKMQGTFLDGHSLEIKLSGKTDVASAPKKSAAAPTSEGLKSKKLMVRNVPFQASRKEILQLFGAYGQLKKVRLPKKFDGSHRGFAFVEFLTSQEAQNAMQALASTHLYGRHLVLEWADDKEDIDALRDRAKRDASHVGENKSTSQVPQNKKIRFDYD